MDTHGLSITTCRSQPGRSWATAPHWQRSGRNTYLFKTPNGRFFLHHTTLWANERDHIEPVSADEARQYYEELTEHEMTYEEAFGEEPEDV